MKRQICLLLAALLCAASLSACSEKPSADPDGSPSSVSPDPGAAAETVPETEETVVPDNLPEVDYNGYTFPN